MRALRILIYGLIGFLAQSTLAAYAAQNDLIERLKSGGHVLMIRHALAPGSGDPANFRLGDCTTQRNLDQTGRVQARAIGNWLRSRGLETAQVYSSQWCRCLETAKLLALGPVSELPALNSFYQRPQDRAPNLKALREFLHDYSDNDQPLVLVTHFVTIAAMTGESVSSGEGVIIDVRQSPAFKVVGRLSFD